MIKPTCKTFKTAEAQIIFLSRQLAKAQRAGAKHQIARIRAKICALRA